jgi:hypothetical protein
MLVWRAMEADYAKPNFHDTGLTDVHIYVSSRVMNHRRTGTTDDEQMDMISECIHTYIEQTVLLQAANAIENDLSTQDG